METNSMSTWINFKSSFDGKINFGQKFMLTIRKLLEKNNELLSSDIDQNAECLDHHHFGKEFKYTIKSDGAIVSKRMDKINSIEEGCKRIQIDNGLIQIKEILNKISKRIITNHENLDF